LILEIADLRPGEARMAEFESAMADLIPVLAATPGYLGHTVQRSQETPGRYILLVRWETLEAHMVGFRQSDRFQEWLDRLGTMREGAFVEHFDTVLSNQWVPEA
jgi:heme-degrading monooxygenase HmoA